jgi:hypothetical protein
MTRATPTFSVRNFERFQHYKDRSPPWIKLYNELLDDYEFGRLPDASKFHLVAIWLLASRSENKIPFDPVWVAKRIDANQPVDLSLLAARGFIVTDQLLHSSAQDASTPQAERLSREEGQVEHIEQHIVSVPSERAPAAPRDEQAELFVRGREVLGQKAGGQIANLLKAKGGLVNLARAAIEAAASKDNPAQYIAAAIKGGAGPPAFARDKPNGAFTDMLLQSQGDQSHDGPTIELNDDQFARH